MGERRVCFDEAVTNDGTPGFFDDEQEGKEEAAVND